MVFKSDRIGQAAEKPRVEKENAMSKDPLLQPFRIKHLTLKNRIMTTSHEPNYAEDGLPKDRYRAYHVERAKGGVSMVMTAGSAIVSRDSAPSFGNLLAYQDEIVPWMAKLAEECRAEGCAVMIQLTHLGRRSHWGNGDWLPTISASGHREIAHRGQSKAAELWDIERIIQDYADAAERMKAAGLDGIEIESYGHLIDQFMSDVTNERADSYGGAFENRMRFADRVLQAVRNRVGPDFIVGIRQVVDELYGEKGITESEGHSIVAHLEQQGLVDFMNVIRGRVDSDPSLTDVIPVTGMASAPHLKFAGHIREKTNLPVFHAARIPDVATARYAVQSGQLDMVGMTRAHMADPHIVRKIIEGREDDIRPCVGATYCLDRIYLGQDAVCTHNAATGRELTQPHVALPAPVQRKVAVVGTGPAGLEAARVCAERGHQVVVYEASNTAGGQVALAAQNPRRKELLSIIDWRMQQCAARDVAFHFNTWAESDDILQLAPDVVFIATGGMAKTDSVGVGQDLAVTAWDIIAGDAKPGGHVLVYDNVGDHTGLQACEVLANSGAKVELMTPDRQIAGDVMGMNLTPYMRALQGLDVTFTIASRLTAITRDGNQLAAQIGSDFVDTLQRQKTYDQIVVNDSTSPLDEIYHDLVPHSRNLGTVDHDALINGLPQTLATNPDGKFQLFRIGDAVTGRNIHAAIYDGLRYGKAI